MWEFRVGGESQRSLPKTTLGAQFTITSPGLLMDLIGETKPPGDQIGFEILER